VGKNLLPQLQLRAEISKVDEENRTIDVVFSTGAEVKRGWFNTYWESLSLKKEHVRLKRLRSGAPMLNAHGSWSLRDVIGVVEKADVDGKQGTASMRFSKREDVEPIFKDVKDKILRNVSVGYKVHKYEDITEGEGKPKRLRAIDWEPMEISIVPIGADANAKIRSEDQETFPVTIIQRSLSVGDELEKDPPKTDIKISEEERKAIEQAAEKRAIERYKKEEQARQTRHAEIVELVRVAQLDESVADNLIKEDASVDHARKVILDTWKAKGEDIPKQRNHIPLNLSVISDETEKRIAGVEEAILNRIDRNSFKLTEQGQQYRTLSLLEISKRILEWNHINHTTMGINDIAIRALSTSDFPLLLENIATKRLRQAYKATPQTFEPYVRRETAPDFKERSVIQMGEAPPFKKTAEGGEIKYGSMEEAAEKYFLATYTTGLKFTRRTIINDDLGGINRTPQAFGQQAMQLESDLFWEIITTNPVMADGKNLFHADHNNLASPGGTVSKTTLDEAFERIGTHKGLDGKTNLNIPPRALVGPNALRGTILTYVNQNLLPRESRLKPTEPSKINIYHDMDSTIESRLHTHSKKAWYVFSKVEDFGDMIEILTLADENGPSIVTEQLGGIKGIEVTAYYDLAAKAIDYRGFYKNEGGA
jgi:hypothetical protein